MRKLGYAYLRKRQTKGEAKALMGGKSFRYIKKEQFAQAVAACDQKSKRCNAKEFSLVWKADAQFNQWMAKVVDAIQKFEG